MSATDPGTEAAPDREMVELSTEEGIAIVPVSYSSLEDNIELNALADRLIQKIAERAGVDLEEQHVMGDESAAPSGDDWLDQNDGVLRLAGHTIDGATLPDRSDVVEAFDAAYRQMPKKYMRVKREFRFYVSEDAEYNLRTTLAERATGAGDRFLTDDAPILLRGVPVVALPALAEREVEAGVDGADGLLIHPQNVVIGIQRRITIEQDRKPRARVVDFVVTARSDVELEQPDAAVKVDGIAH